MYWLQWLVLVIIDYSRIILLVADTIPTTTTVFTITQVSATGINGITYG